MKFKSKHLLYFILSLCISVSVLAFVDDKSNKFKRTVRKNPNSLTMKLTNGNWFNGVSLDKRTIWVNEGISFFSDQEIKVDTIIDLKGQYVILPFA